MTSPSAPVILRALRSPGFSTKIVGLLSLLAAVLLVCAAGAFHLLREARADRRVHAIDLHARLIAEMRSPTWGLSELHRLAGQLASNLPRSEQPELILRLGEAERDYRQRHADWLAQLDDAVIESSLDTDCAQPAANYLRLLHQRFFPALIRGRPDAALTGEMEAAFRAYRDGTDRAVTVARRQYTSLATAQANALRRCLWQLALIVALALGASATVATLIIRAAARLPREDPTALHPSLISDLDAATARINAASARIAALTPVRDDDLPHAANGSSLSPRARDAGRDRAFSPHAVPSLRRFSPTGKTVARFVSEIAPDPVARRVATPALAPATRPAAFNSDRIVAMTEALKSETASLRALVQRVHRLIEQEIENQRLTLNSRRPPPPRPQRTVCG